MLQFQFRPTPIDGDSFERELQAAIVRYARSRRDTKERRELATHTEALTARYAEHVGPVEARRAYGAILTRTAGELARGLWLLSSALD